MRYALIFITILFSSNIFAADNKFAVIPFSSTNPESASQLTSKCISSAPFEIKSIDPNIQVPSVPDDGMSSEKYISDIAGIARKSGADFCLTGSIEQINDTISIFAIVINAKNNTIAYKTLLSVDAKNKKYDPSVDIWGRIKNNLEGISYPVKNLSASKGLFNTEVTLNWDPVPKASEYAIHRSNSVNGIYDLIALSKLPTFG
jgi:TolB-like protein